MLKKLKRPLFTLTGLGILGVWLLACPIPGLAGSVPGVGIVVFSEYQSPVPGRRPTGIKWVFAEVPEAGERRFTVRDAEHKVAAWADVSYTGDGKLSGLHTFRLVRGRPVTDEQLSGGERELLVLQESLIPLDWFNCPLTTGAIPAERKWILKKKLGRARFVTRLLIRCREIDYAEAVAAGMITDDNRRMAKARPLYLREALRVLKGGREEPLLRQLWTAEAGFWLYEEKGGRRSWRCRP